MIKIVYNKTENHVSIAGHAGTAPKGEDLLCAATTALAVTLAANVEQMEATGTASAAHIDLQDGSADISCTPAPGMEYGTQLIFQAICLGFQSLAEANPDAICYGLEMEK